MTKNMAPAAPSAVRMLTVEDVANLTGLCTKTVRKLISEGDLEAKRIGRFIRVRELDLANWQARAPRVPAARKSSKAA
jgi:excisionase family DNA binding protein